MAKTIYMPRARQKPNPEPATGYHACVEGAVLIGNAEQRLDRFDNGWEMTFAASWGDSRAKLLCWKVYPKPETEAEAVRLVVRRAASLGIRKIAFVLVSKPEKEKQ